jgi:hypothetical protein
MARRKRKMTTAAKRKAKRMKMINKNWKRAKAGLPVSWKGYNW